MPLRFIFRSLVILSTYLVTLSPAVSSAEDPVLFDVEIMADRITGTCEGSSGNDYLGMVACLNEETQKFIAGDLQNFYQAEVLKLADRIHLTQFNSETVPPLAGLYRVYIPTANENREPWRCVDLSEQDHRNHQKNTGVLSSRKVKATARGLLQASLFLRKYATLSFGKPFSPLLGFDEIQVCDYSTYDRLMKLDRGNRVLVIASTREQRPYQTNDLFAEWRSGDAVNPLVNKWAPRFFEKLGYLNIEKSEYMDYTLYRQWQKMDPMSTIRNKLRAIALMVAGEVTTGTGIRDLPNYFSALRRKLVTAGTDGVASLESDLHTLDVWKRSENIHGLLNEHIQAKMRDPQWVARVLASHLTVADQLCAGTRSSTYSAKDQSGVFNFANAKAVTVDVSFAPSPAYQALSAGLYVDKSAVCAESEFVNLDKQRGLVNINPSDNVLVNVKGLGQLTDALLLMPQLALYELIHQGSWSESPRP